MTFKPPTAGTPVISSTASYTSGDCPVWDGTQFVPQRAAYLQQAQTTTALVASLPIYVTAPTKFIIAQVGPFDLLTNDLVLTTLDVEVTNDQVYNVEFGTSVISATSNAATTGTNVLRASAGNVTPSMHHWALGRSTVEKIPGTRAGRYYSLVCYAAASAANPAHTDLLTVEALSGQFLLSVTVIRGGRGVA